MHFLKFSGLSAMLAGSVIITGCGPLVTKGLPASEANKLPAVMVAQADLNCAGPMGAVLVVNKGASFDMLDMSGMTYLDASNVYGSPNSFPKDSVLLTLANTDTSTSIGTNISGLLVYPDGSFVFEDSHTVMPSMLSTADFGLNPVKCEYGGTSTPFKVKKNR